MRHKKIASGIKLILVCCLVISACKKDTGREALLPDAPKDTFMPRTNTKYEYRILNEDVATGTATKWIDGGKDSSGINVYNLHTKVTSSFGEMSMDNTVYAANGKTYTGFNMPDAWHTLVKELTKLPGVEIQEARAIGFPGYMLLENNLKEGSKLTWEIPGKTGQYVRYLQKSSGSTVKFEMTQEIVQSPGSAVAVESITVPAGTFTCSKFVYTSTQKQSIKLDDSQEMTKNGNENVTMWMAHGIGLVRQVAVSNFAGTTTTSTTLLSNIKK